MNFLEMLSVVTTPIEPKPPRKAPIGPGVRQQRADAKYKLLFEEYGPMTTAKIATRLGYSHAGVLSSLYALEKRGLVVRAGKEPISFGRATIIWTWNDHGDEK